MGLGFLQSVVPLLQLGFPLLVLGLEFFDVGVAAGDLVGETGGLGLGLFLQGSIALLVLSLALLKLRTHEPVVALEQLQLALHQYVLLVGMFEL